MARRHCYFGLEEANAVIPTLEYFFQHLLLLRHELEGLRWDLEQAGVVTVGDALQGPEDTALEVLPLQERYFDRCRQYDVLLDELLSLGVELVDEEAGIVNFYSWWNGEEVVLSWQYGEPTVQFWYDPGEGFMARRPIQQLFFDAPVGGMAHH